MAYGKCLAPAQGKSKIPPVARIGFGASRSKLYANPAAKTGFLAHDQSGPKILMPSDPFRGKSQ
jgi:hypothetical protein